MPLGESPEPVKATDEEEDGTGPPSTSQLLFQYGPAPATEEKGPKAARGSRADD